MNISSALKSNRLCAAMTGLTIIEFGTLVPVFASVVDAMRRENTPIENGNLVQDIPVLCVLRKNSSSLPSFISKATLLWMFFHFSLALTGVMLAETRSFCFLLLPVPSEENWYSQATDHLSRGILPGVP